MDFDFTKIIEIFTKFFTLLATFIAKIKGDYVEPTTLA